MIRNGLPAALVALLPLLAAVEAAAQAGTATTSSVTQTRTARPVPPVRPQPTPTGPQAAAQQADLEQQVRDMILRQGRMQMNALVPGSGLALAPGRFDDGIDLMPPPAIAPPARVDTPPTAAADRAAPPRRPPPPRLQRFRMGERVSDPLPMRRAGNYAW